MTKWYLEKHMAKYESNPTDTTTVIINQRLETISNKILGEPCALKTLRRLVDIWNVTLYEKISISH